MLDTLYQKDSIVLYESRRIDSFSQLHNPDSVRFSSFTETWYEQTDSMLLFLFKHNSYIKAGFLRQILEWLHIVFDAKIMELKRIAKSLPMDWKPDSPTSKNKTAKAES